MVNLEKVTRRISGPKSRNTNMVGESHPFPWTKNGKGERRGKESEWPDTPPFPFPSEGISQPLLPLFSRLALLNISRLPPSPLHLCLRWNFERSPPSISAFLLRGTHLRYAPKKGGGKESGLILGDQMVARRRRGGGNRFVVVEEEGAHTFPGGKRVRNRKRKGGESR